MYRISFLVFFFCLLSVAVTTGASRDPFDAAVVLKSRKVLGVVYFSGKSSKLTSAQQREIQRISTIAAEKLSEDKVLRVEGFTNQNLHRDNVNSSFARAKTVWLYMMNNKLLDSADLYMTGFSPKQSLSRLKGERVEIAVYQNPFTEKYTFNN